MPRLLGDLRELFQCNFNSVWPRASSNSVQISGATSPAVLLPRLTRPAITGALKATRFYRTQLRFLVPVYRALREVGYIYSFSSPSSSFFFSFSKFLVDYVRRIRRSFCKRRGKRIEEITKSGQFINVCINIILTV